MDDIYTNAKQLLMRIICCDLADHEKQTAVESALKLAYMTGLHAAKNSELGYTERQNKWLSDNNLHIGDEVKVVRKVVSYSEGWDNEWSYMDSFIGELIEITRVHPTKGIRTADGASFPYLALEVVNNGDNNV